MKLDFEIIKEVGSGNYPDLLHFPNTQAQLFYVEDGELYGLPSNKIPNGEWEGLTLQDNTNVSPDADMSHFELKMLSGFGVIGSYKTGDTHKLIIYEFAFEMDKYLSEGSIKHSINNPISSFNLTLENPDINNPERPGNIVANEKATLLAPGSKIVFKFGAGRTVEPDFDLGVFYVDRSNFTLQSEVARVNGRNLIGKALREQTLDECNSYALERIDETIRQMLENAHLSKDDYLIEPSSERLKLEFKPNTDYLQALEELFKATIDWQIKELTDGTIVVGSPDYAGFDRPGTYRFYRDKDIFSRQITRDDAESYRRVCVHNNDFTIIAYRDVSSYEGWNLQANKTLYVRIPEGTKQSRANSYAYELAKRLEKVGKIESFTGPIRPHIQCGDQAIIVDSDGEENLGLITEVTHEFGKGGFRTSFTVDSGGMLGKGRLSDYINQITRDRTSGSIEYGEL